MSTLSKKHFQETASTQRSLHFSPGFPVEVGCVDQDHAVSFKENRIRVVASIAKEEIRVRFGRDDKGEMGASGESSC